MNETKKIGPDKTTNSFLEANFLKPFNCWSKYKNLTEFI